MDYAPLIEYAANDHGLNDDIVYGVCVAESSLNHLAARFEQKYRWLYKPQDVKPPTCSLLTEEALQRTSIGLMQIMGAVAREIGFRGWLTELFSDPSSQLQFGCEHLSRLIGMHGLTGGIAAYNAGIPKRMSTGEFVNQKYVNSVLKHAADYRNKKVSHISSL